AGAVPRRGSRRPPPPPHQPSRSFPPAAGDRSPRAGDPPSGLAGRIPGIPARRSRGHTIRRQTASSMLTSVVMQSAGLLAQLLFDGGKRLIERAFDEEASRLDLKGAGSNRRGLANRCAGKRFGHQPGIAWVEPYGGGLGWLQRFAGGLNCLDKELAAKLDGSQAVHGRDRKFNRELLDLL